MQNASIPSQAAPIGSTPVTQNVPPGQVSSPFLDVASPGQPTQPSQQNIFDLYNSLKNNYYQPLNQPLNLSSPPLNDPTIQGLANQLLATANKSSVGNGSQPPSPDSVIAKASQHLTVGEVAAEVGQETIQQMIMEPFHQLVDTWQRDPKMGLLETLGGAAVVGGLVALSGTAVGAAAVFGLGAAIVMPGMINGWLDELQHPTDTNLVKALVGTSTGILTVGTPGKALSGLGQLRRGYELESKAFMNSIEPRDITRQWVTFFKGTFGEFQNVPAGKQMDVLANTYDAMTRQFKQRGISTEETEAGELLLLQKRLDGLVASAQAAAVNDDSDLVESTWKEITDLTNPKEKGGYYELRGAVSRNYQFLPERPFSHVPMWGKIKKDAIAAGDWKKLNAARDTIMGKLDFLIGAHGFFNQEQAPSAASAVEKLALSLSGGHAEGIINEIVLNEHKAAEILGISDARPDPATLGHLKDEAWSRLSPYEQIEVGLESQPHWAKLSPQQQLYGSIRTELENGLSIAQYKAGVIPLMGKGGVRRIRTAVNPDEGQESLLRDPLRPMTGKIHSFKRTREIAFDPETASLQYNEKRTRIQELEDEMRREEAYSPEFQQFWQEHGTQITQERKRLGGLKGQLTHRTNLRDNFPAKTKVGRRKQAETVVNIQSKIDDAAGRIDNELKLAGHDEETAKKIMQHIFLSEEQLRTAKEQMPLGRRLMTGQQLVRASVAAAVYRLHSADFVKTIASHANTASDTIAKNIVHPDMADDMSTFLQRQEFVSQIEGKPAFLNATAFRGGGVGSLDTKAREAGYAQVAPQIGEEGDLHFQPGYYARSDIAAQIQRAYDNSYTSADFQEGVMGALYKTVSTTKHVIMLSPAWHYMNVMGRVLGFVLNDPAVALPAIRTMLGKPDVTLADPRLRALLSAEFTSNGGKSANSFNVSRALHMMDQEENAQSRWPSALRTPAGALWHAYEKHVEDGFWKMVDDFQLYAYQYAQHHLRTANPNIPAEEIPRLAALYANDLGGMVNPIYMNKMYRHLRNMVWFAPSYWATFMRSLESLMPGADRISGFLSTYRGGEFTRFGAVPLKAVSDIGRRELVRMHRSWMITYMATAVTAADLLNVLMGGRHLWDNDEGHKFDVNVDKAAGLFGAGPQQKGTATKHAYFSGMPMFRQAIDVANALGLGHDYGFGHQFGDQQWQQMDALHKTMMLAGGLLQGTEEQAASKMAAPVQAGYGVLTGETLSGRAKGVQRQIGGPLGRLDALSSFIPGGSAAESALTQDQPPLDAAKTWGGSLLQQYTGLPSIYHLGIEQPPVDDSKMKSWSDQRTQIQNNLKGASAQMFAGQIQPIQYERLRQQSVDKLLQLDADTFGNSTPVGALSRARLELEQANGLQRNDLTDSQWAERNDLFQMEWDQLIQNASPEARAAWWEAETSQWTDADYLVWEAQQMRQALMASIDGQGGQHIRAYQHQIGPLLDIPSTALRTELEQGDPYYYLYRQTLKAMASTSSLGAFISAFTSPYANMMIEPENLTPEQEQALMDEVNTSATLIRPKTARALAAEAKLRAKSQAVAEAGGKAQADPGFDQEVAAMIEEAKANA